VSEIVVSRSVYVAKLWRVDGLKFARSLGYHRVEFDIGLACNSAFS
jgi:hypothetical protein